MQIYRSSDMRCQQPDASTSGRDLLSACHSEGRRFNRRHAVKTSCSRQKEVTLLDYGAGNVRSVRNAILKLGYTLKEVGTSAGHIKDLSRKLPLATHLSAASP